MNKKNYFKTLSQKALAILLMLGFMITLSCNNDDDDNSNGGGTTNHIIGTWKLVAEYSNGSLVTLNACKLQENYIFGQTQFTHETYGLTGGRMSSSYPFDDSLQQRGGDDDSSDDSSDDGSDDGSDDSTDDGTDDGSDDGTDDATDDGSDDGSDDGGTGGVCTVLPTIIGSWTNPNGTTYNLTANSVTDAKVIHFTDGNTKFYYEITQTVGGVTTTKKYVFQRQ